MSLGSFFKSFMSFLLPVAQVAATIAAPKNPVVGAVLAGVPALMDAVEAISPQANGKVKSDAVHAAVQVMFNGMGAVVTGGAKESYDTYKPLVQAVIDNGIAAVNAQKPVPGPAVK